MKKICLTNGLRLILASIVLLCSACVGSNGNLAPVVNAWRTQNVQGHYRVLPGDTLYSVAWRFGVDYRQLARINNIAPPYEIYKGQQLLIGSRGNGSAALSQAAPSRSLAPVVSSNTQIHSHPRSRQQSTAAHRQPRTKKAPRTASKVQRKTRRVIKTPARKHVKRHTSRVVSRIRWQWPTHGKVSKGFSNLNKGIDIVGKYRQPVMTTAPGVVVYAGSGLRGYGKLLIVKHNDNFLSAYAHNSVLLVKEGQRVRAGQKIALMGKTGSTKVMLHFEIRRAGKPVNPLRYLPRR